MRSGYYIFTHDGHLRAVVQTRIMARLIQRAGDRVLKYEPKSTVRK
jgi:hypothetical protein